MFWLKTIVVVGRSSSRRPNTKGVVTFSFSTCHLLTFSLVVFSLLYFSFSPSVCVMNFYKFTPTFHHVTTIWLGVYAQYGCSSVCLSSTSSVITVIVIKTLYIYSTAVLAQGVFFRLRVTVARYRRDFQLLCPCGELNLLQLMTYFMYHQLYHS